MAASRIDPRRLGVALAVGVLLPVASCAQITGLSDEYRYDLEAGAGSSEDGSAVGLDASPGDARSDADARAQCSADDRTRTGTQLASASGELLSPQCRTCLAASCCAPIDACAKSSDCQASMKCVFQCQKSGSAASKRQCLSDCNVAAFQRVGSCAESGCAGACNLQ